MDIGITAAIVFRTHEVVAVVSRPPCPNWRNWFFISLLLNLMVIEFQKPCTKTEEGAGLVMYDVYLKGRGLCEQ